MLESLPSSGIHASQEWIVSSIQSRVTALEAWYQQDLKKFPFHLKHKRRKAKLARLHQLLQTMGAHSALQNQSSWAEILPLLGDVGQETRQRIETVMTQRVKELTQLEGHLQDVRGWLQESYQKPIGGFTWNSWGSKLQKKISVMDAYQATTDAWVHRVDQMLTQLGAKEGEHRIQSVTLYQKIDQGFQEIARLRTEVSLWKEKLTQMRLWLLKEEGHLKGPQVVRKTLETPLPFEVEKHPWLKRFQWLKRKLERAETLFQDAKSLKEKP